MKKGKLTTIATGLVLGTSMLFAGCGEASITSYDFTGEKEQYLVYENFSYEDLKLTLRMSDGSTKEITITEDMIEELPDLSTKGEKVLKIKYEGKIYEMKFTVGGQTKEEMQAKIEAFYNDYKNNLSSGDIAMNIDGNFTAKWFGDSQTINTSFIPEDIVLHESDTRFDAMLNALYNSSIKALVKTTTDLSLTNITDSNNNASTLSFQAILDHLSNTVTNLDFIQHIVDTVVLPGPISTHVENVTNALMTALYLPEEAKSELKPLVASNLDHLKHLKDLTNKPTWEGNVYINYIKDFANEINNITQTHSTEKHLKTAINSINTSLQESNANAVSALLTDFANSEISLVYHYVEETQGDTYYSYYTQLENADTIEFTQKLFSYYSEFAKAFEDFLDVEHFETADTAKTAITTLINTLKTTNTKLLSIQDTIDQNEEWVINDLTYNNEALTTLDSILNCYDEESYIETTINIIKEFKVVEMVLDLMTQYIYNDNSETVLPDTFKTIIRDAVISLIRSENFETVDYEQYITSVCNMINDENFINPEHLYGTYDKDTYLEAYRTNGYATILSDALQQEVLDFPPENPETSHSYKAMLSAKDMLLVIDKIPLNKGIDFEELLKHASKMFAEAYLSEQNEQQEPSQEPESGNGGANAGQQISYVPAIYDHILDIFSMLTNPDYADKTAPDYNEETFEFNLADCLETNIHKVENKYKTELAEVITYNFSKLVRIRTTGDAQGETTVTSGFERGSVGYAELENFFLTVINNHLNGTFILENSARDFIGIINSYGHSIIKPYINLSTALGLVMSGEELDYNKVFESIPLPSAIGRVDYNQLIEKVMTGKTWEDAIDLSQVQVKFETNEQGKIVKEIMTVTLSCDLDLQLMGLVGDLSYRFEILF